MNTTTLRRFRALGILVPTLAALYALVFLALTVLVIVYGISPLLWVLIPLSFGSLLLLTKLVPPRSPKIQINVLRSRSLEASLERIAAALGQDDRPVLAADFNANAAAVERRGKRFVFLGLAMVCAYSQEELDFVLAHEMAHHFHGDSTDGKVIFQLDALVGRIGSLLSNRMALAVLLPFLPVFRSLLRAVRKAQRTAEFDADTLAGSIVGSTPAVGALEKLPAIERHWEVFCSCWLSIVVTSRVPADLFVLYREFASALPVLQTPGWTVPSSISAEYDSHPAVKERVANVQKQTPGQPMTGAFHRIDNSADLSGHFYTRLGWSVEGVESGLIEAYQTIGQAMVEKFGETVAGFSWTDVENIAWHYSDYSRRFFELTGIDDFTEEWRTFVFVIGFLVFSRTRPHPRLSWRFGPILTVNGLDWDATAAIEALHRGPQRELTEHLAVLGVDPSETVLTGRPGNSPALV